MAPEGRSIAEIAKAAHPRPWDWQWIGANASGGGHVYLVDATGRKIAAVWGKAVEKEAAADLICALVNGIP